MVNIDPMGRREISIGELIHGVENGKGELIHGVEKGKGKSQRRSIKLNRP